MPSPLTMLVLGCLLLAGVAGMEAESSDATEKTQVTNPVASTPDSISAGETVYMRRCRGCHGQDGAGTTGPNLVDDSYDHGSTDGDIYTVIREGIPPDYNMEPFDDRLDETDAWNVVNFLRSLQTP